MRIRISDNTTEAQARAIAEAMAAQYQDDVTVVTDGGDEIADASYDGRSDATTESDPGPELGPTAREETLLAEINEILEGGPEKYKEQLSPISPHTVRARSSPTRQRRPRNSSGPATPMTSRFSTSVTRPALWPVHRSRKTGS